MKRLLAIIVILIWGNTEYAFCQAEKHPELIVNNLVDDDDNVYRISDNDTCLFVIVSERNCTMCFEELCQNYISSPYKNYTVRAVGILKYNLLALMPLSSRINGMVACNKQVLFHYTDAGTFADIYNAPSPQLVIKEGRKLRYLNYTETMNWIASLKKTKR